jgi:phosphoglycolate phosphatase
MSVPPRLVVFDVDGTLVDSQHDILAAMRVAFSGADLPAPSRDDVLGIVGLSLPVAMARLVPAANGTLIEHLTEGYKAAYVELRAETGAAQSSPLFPGARETLEMLAARPDVLLGVATGKSKRGLDKLIEAHGLEGVFVTRQVADFHPSKPHPAMLQAAMTEAGAAPETTVMIGDTSFDMEMARSAGAVGLGVSWGYHPVSLLGAAARVLDDFADLPAALAAVWRE